MVKHFVKKSRPDLQLMIRQSDFRWNVAVFFWVPLVVLAQCPRRSEEHWSHMSSGTPINSIGNRSLLTPKPLFIVLAGPNGAGKSTGAASLIPPDIPYINADEVSKLLTDVLTQKSRDIKAARMILRQMDEFEQLGQSFAVETTLASRSLASRAESLQRQGYVFSLIYFWTPNPEFSISRVASRVRAGGHNIPDDTIRRRYHASLRNFFGLYQPIADAWEVFDNTELGLLLRPIADGKRDRSLRIHDSELWASMKQSFANA